MISTAKMPAKAAGITDSISIFAAFDSEGEIVFAGPALGIRVNESQGAFMMMDEDTMQDVGAETVYLATANGKYELLFGSEEEFAGHSLSIWVLDTQGPVSDSAFLTMGIAHQGDIVTAVYVNKDLETSTMDIALTDCGEDGLLVMDGGPTDIIYPAPLVSESGELVAILLAKDCAWAIGGGNGFYDTASQAPQNEAPQNEEPQNEEPQKAPPLPERPSGQGTDTTDPDTPTPAPGGNGAGTQSKDTGGFPGGIAIAVGAVVIAAVAFIFVKGRKKTQAPAAVSYQTNAAPKAEDIQKTVPYAEAPASVPFTPAPPAAAPAKPQFWLTARGGYMNGRVYPVEKNEITIGRDVSSVICYPADTAGVSRVHAKLYWQNGQLMLMDCNSTSGTFLQRQGKLAPMNPIAVQSGDVFYIGEKINGFEIRN